MFNCRRLVLARKRRKLTAKRLAEYAKVSAVTITRLEKGENQPEESTIRRLADALNYPIEFFLRDDPEPININSVSFRSLTKMTARERDAAITAGSLGIELNGWIEERFSLPIVKLLDLSYETDTEAAAQHLRQHWALGERPIRSIVRLLEAHGVRVFALSEDTATVDAFSFWKNDKPYVFLNHFKTAERSIYDAAHELGHLVLHKHAGPIPSRPAEREADSFASAFLMPRNDVRSRVPSKISIDVILELKLRWRVSAMALAYRLHALEMLTDWQYKSICIELGKRGFRSGEPGGIEREESVVWRKIFSQLWSEKTTKSDVAEALNIPLDELEGIVGLSRSNRARERFNLHAVK